MDKMVVWLKLVYDMRGFIILLYFCVCLKFFLFKIKEEKMNSLEDQFLQPGMITWWFNLV